MKLRMQFALIAALISLPVTYAAPVTLPYGDTFADPELWANQDPDLGTLESLIAPDGTRLANTLWSSTRSVKTFARGMTQQLDVYHGPWKEMNPAAYSGKGAHLTKVRNDKTNIWAGGQGEWSRMASTSDIGGYEYNGGGYSVGVDHAFNTAFTGGLAAGETFGSNKAKWGSADFDQRNLMIGTYGRYKTDIGPWNAISIDGYFAYGSTRNKGNMSLNGAPDVPAHAKWDDNAYTAGLSFSWEIQASKHSSWIPFFGIDYIYGSQNSFSLNTPDGSLRYHGGNMQVWTIPVGITYRAVCQVGAQQYLIPEVTVAYEGDVSRRNPSIKTDIMGDRLKIEGSNPGRHALLANTGMRWVMNHHWSMGAYYTLERRSRWTDHTVNGSINYTF